MFALQPRLRAREGFQIESSDIPTAQKVRFIEALAETGLKQIDCLGLVNPRRVPGMADADAVVKGFTAQPGVNYTALWLNDTGLKRALSAGRLTVSGDITLCASEPFLKRNLGTPAP